MNTNKIMLVDDNVDFLKGMALILTQYGMKPLTYTNVQEAKEKVEQELPDVAIIDIIMPSRYGYELIYYIKQKFINIPVIAISGGGKTLDAYEYLKTAEVLGATYVLQKPVEAKEIIKIIHKYLQ